MTLVGPAGLSSGYLVVEKELALSARGRLLPARKPVRPARLDGYLLKCEGAVVVPLREFLFVIVGSVALSLVILATIWLWTREPRLLGLIDGACLLGIVVWNIALNLADATSLNADSDILGLSVQDVGSGVLAFLAVAAALAVGSHGTSPGRVLGAAAIVGIVTLVVDRYG